MRKLPAIALATVAAAALAGTAIAASPTSKTHVMDVTLPDGSIAHVEYAGEVKPKITFDSRAMAGLNSPWAMSMPGLAGFDRMMADMQRQSQEMVRRAQEMARHPVAPGATPYIASYGDMPAGRASTTVVSVSNNGVTCTWTTEVVSQGAGKPPKVTSSASGTCDGGSPSGRRLNRT